MLFPTSKYHQVLSSFIHIPIWVFDLTSLPFVHQSVLMIFLHSVSFPLYFSPLPAWPPHHFTSCSSRSKQTTLDLPAWPPHHLTSCSSRSKQTTLDLPAWPPHHLTPCSSRSKQTTLDLSAWPPHHLTSCSSRSKQTTLDLWPQLRPQGKRLLRVSALKSRRHG